MKPQNGWYDPDNDTILVKADIWAEAPIGLKLVKYLVQNLLNFH